MSRSSVFLLLSNIATLAAALLLHWSTGWMLWAYFLQNLAIGGFACRRMLTLDRFDASGFQFMHRPILEDERGKRLGAMFFCVHYGLFHSAYLGYLASTYHAGSMADIVVVAACGGSFALAQRQTYAVQHAADLRGKPSLGMLWMTPYLRTAPMLVPIVIGMATDGEAGLWVMGVLKTGVDLVLDHVDRRIAERAADKATGAMPRS
jgi:hypothetical protein